MGIVSAALWVLSAVSGACRPPSDGTGMGAESTVTNAKPGETQVEVRDLLAESDLFANDEQVREELGQIAWSMGYGYYWGCPDKTEGWLRSEAIKKDDQTREVRFFPSNSHACPQGQPGLKTTMRFRVKPISGVETYDIKQLSSRGAPVVKASMRCEGMADACSIQHIVSTGYTTQVTKTRDFSFGQNAGLGGGVKFSTKFFGVGGDLSVDVFFKLKFGTSMGTSVAEGTNGSETAMYTCPLVERQPSRRYLGAIISTPVQIAAKHKMKVKLVPEVSFEGFPRVSDSGGNHWLDHPRDRPIRIQSYGYETTPFWQEMKYYSLTGHDKKDQNGDSRLSWANINADGQHGSTSRKSIEYFERFNARIEAQAESQSVTNIDDLICLWVDVTNPDNPQPVKATAAGKKDKKDGDLEDLIASGKLPPEVQKALTTLLLSTKQ